MVPFICSAYPHLCKKKKVTERPSIVVGPLHNVSCLWMIQQVTPLSSSLPHEDTGGLIRAVCAIHADVVTVNDQ